MMVGTEMMAVIRGVGITALLGAMALAAPALAAPQGWECDAGLCTETAEAPITRLTGDFEYGANLSRDSRVDRLAELEQQRWREFRFVVAAPARIYARGSVDRSYQPADWPKDISLGNVSIGVSRHVSTDGETYEKIDDGAVVSAGSYLSIVVEQDTWGVGAAYATYYPSRWAVDLTARRVVDEAELGNIDPGALPVVADDGTLDLALDAAIDADLGCQGSECVEPDDQPVATHADGTPVQGDAIDPNAVDVAADDDPTLAVDPMVGDCGQDMMECKPIDDMALSEPDVGEECSEGQLECVAADALALPVVDNPEADLLAVELQTELARVGCYEAAIDGLWGPASRRAMTNFNHWAGADALVDRPSPKALVTVARTPAPVCGVD